MIHEKWSFNSFSLLRLNAKRYKDINITSRIYKELSRGNLPLKINKTLKLLEMSEWNLAWKFSNFICSFFAKFVQYFIFYNWNRLAFELNYYKNNLMSLFKHRIYPKDWDSYFSKFSWFHMIENRLKFSWQITYEINYHQNWYKIKMVMEFCHFFYLNPEINI